MKKYIVEYRRKCDKCAARKPSKQRNRAPLGQYLAGEPMERVEVDILGPLPVTERGNRYILVTRVIVNEYISRFGIPLYCNLIRGDCLKLNFSRISVTSCGLTRQEHPQSNGHVESFNRTPLCMLTCYCENDQKYWDDILPQVLMAYRSSVHASTGQTPNMIMFGRNITLPMEAVIPRPMETCERDTPEIEDYVINLQERMNKSHFR
jgi:hypothetical protein